MAVFISVTTSALEDSDTAQRQDAQHVRRPLRGIQLKEDRYATLRVVSATGEDILLVDSGSQNNVGGIGMSSRYSNFILQRVQETRIEKQQIIETFGDDYVFFFGEKPRIMSFQGCLMNTKDFNWKNEWWSNYHNTFRGTRLVEANARAYLYFDDIVVSGYALSSSSEDIEANPYMVSFSFQLFVTDHVDLSTVGSVFFQSSSLSAGPPNTLVPGAASVSAAAVEANAKKTAIQGGAGGFTSFLATVRDFGQGLSFGAQSAITAARDTLFGRQTVFPADLSSAVTLPPIENQAKFSPAPTNQPIHTMADEYVQRSDRAPQFDRAEMIRVSKELQMRSPAALDARARADLAKLGIDATPRSTTALLLGRGAFAGVQTFGSFGIRKAQGALDMSRVDQLGAGVRDVGLLP